MFTILVTGSRSWRSVDIINHAFDDLGFDPDARAHVIHGGARGADSLAHHCADERGWRVTVYPAQWSIYGRSAGYRRNVQMLREGRPNIVLAFWDGRSPGTRHMLQTVIAHRIPHRLYLGA